jgi:succinyl-CoA synthetase alpha subunit
MITRSDGVLVQGITGRQGSFWTARMREYGTRVVAGVTPGKGGRDVDGIAVYDSVAEASERHDVDAAVMFVPPLAAKAGCLDAIASGARLVVLLTEHIPIHDTMEILAAAADRGVRVLGPNTAGLVVPGEVSLGIMPAFAPNVFQPGRIGVISRSGSLGTLMCLNVVRAGLGQSMFIGIGGDPLIGTTMRDAVRLLDEDPGTDAIVMVGEVGGALEEEAAEDIAELSTPVVAFIAGRSSPPGRRMGHAGAIVTGRRGSGPSKVGALTDAGATVIDLPSQLGQALAAALGESPAPAAPATSPR